jgi:hypothetical protein
MLTEMVEIKSQKLGLIMVLACIPARAFDSLWCLSLSSAAGPHDQKRSPFKATINRR